MDATGGSAIDRLLIAERIHRYGWCFDERNPELLGDCFTADGVWEGRIMGEVSVGPFEGRSAIVQWLSDFWPQQFDQRRHVFTNVTVDDLTATTATAHAYLLLRAFKIVGCGSGWVRVWSHETRVGWCQSWYGG